MQNRGENEDFYQPDLGDFTTPRKVSFRQKIDMWAKEHRGDMLRGIVIFFALGVMWKSGHTSATLDFGRAIQSGYYIVNATMFEQVEKAAGGEDFAGR